jgi:hypothetical protein
MDSMKAFKTLAPSLSYSDPVQMFPGKVFMFTEFIIG